MKILALLCAAMTAAGCAHSPTPQYDMRFGDAVRTARLAMSIDPNAGARVDLGRGLDGRAASEAIKRYHDSFKQPPPVTNVIHIDGMAGGGGK